jgi:hypothetical protein
LFAQWLSVTGQAVEFAVTPQVTDTLLGDGKLSLRIASTGDYGAPGNVNYASRENANAANRPQLILTIENNAPTISSIADQAIQEDTATPPLAFTLADDLTGPEALSVSGVSSDTTLVPHENIVFSGSGTNRSVIVTPAPNQSGSATITLTVNDGSLGSDAAFVLTVSEVDDPPTANPGAVETRVNQPVEIDLRTLANDSETQLADLRFAASGGQNGTVVLLPDGFTARFTPAGGDSGPAGFSYSVTDSSKDPRVFLNYSFQPPDVTSDGSSTDVSGNGRNATITSLGNGSATHTADFPAALAPQHSQSLLLTENDSAGASRLQRIISPTTELDFKTVDWTVAAWVKRSEAVDQDIVFHLGTGNGRGGSNALALSFGNGSSITPLYLRNWNASGQDVDLSVPVSAGVWHHLAVVRAGTSLTLYVDGLPVASDDSFAITANSNASSTPAIFGGGTSTTTGALTDRYFDGAMADLAIFSAPLSASEILRLHSGPVANLGGQSASSHVAVTVIPAADPMAGWRQHYFQTSVNAGDAADSEDPDGDGLSNAREFVFGSHPLQPAPGPALHITVAGDVVTLSFVAVAADGPGYGGMLRQFTVEATADPSIPGSWGSVAGHSDIVAAGQTVTLSPPAGGDSHFYRLKVSLK